MTDPKPVPPPAPAPSNPVDTRNEKARRLYGGSTKK
jgi:hypothetical protein